MIAKIIHRIKSRNLSDDYWVAKMERELAELQKTNTTKASTKSKEKLFMVNAKEGKTCIIESKGITIIDKLT